MVSTELAERARLQLESRARVNAYLAEHLLRIPEGGADALEQILQAIVTIERIEDIDAPWNSNGFGEYADHVLTLRAAKRLASDYKDSCGWFVVVDAIVKATGEPVALSTSSTAVMAQILVLQDKGWFPVDMIPRYADRPTEAGYYPMHLDLHRGEPLEPKAKVGGQRLSREQMDNINAKRHADRAQVIRENEGIVDAQVVSDTEEVPY